MMATKIKLGDLAKDKITGFTGVVICVSNFLNGCTRCAIQPKELEKGIPIEEHYFDIEQLVKVKESTKAEAKPKGGPRKDAPLGRPGE